MLTEGRDKIVKIIKWKTKQTKCIQTILQILTKTIEYNNQVLNKTIELQTDIDMAASAFADKDFVGQLASLALERLPQRGVAFVDMADIPDPIEIKKPVNDELAAYIKKLKVYNYYLVSNVQQDYRYDLKVLNKTLASLESLNG